MFNTFGTGSFHLKKFWIWKLDFQKCTSGTFISWYDYPRQRKGWICDWMILLKNMWIFTLNLEFESLIRFLFLLIKLKLRHRNIRNIWLYRCWWQMLETDFIHSKNPKNMEKVINIIILQPHITVTKYFIWYKLYLCLLTGTVIKVHWTLAPIMITWIPIKWALFWKPSVDRRKLTFLR